MRAIEFITEAGNPQMVARRISAPRVSTVDTSAPWVKSAISKASARRRGFNELESGKEKFDYLYNLKDGRSTNKIKIVGGKVRSAARIPMTLHVQSYTPATGDITLLARERGTDIIYKGNTNNFEFDSVERTISGGSTKTFTFYAHDLEQLSQQKRVAAPVAKPAAPVNNSPWAILDKKK